jgi:hypothetical protein
MARAKGFGMRDLSAGACFRHASMAGEPARRLRQGHIPTKRITPGTAPSASMVDVLCEIAAIDRPRL